MGRIYTVAATATITAANTDVDLLELLPADDKPCKLRGFAIGNFSEVGDTQEEGIRVTIRHMTATVTSGNGTATTGRPMDSADAAAGFTAETFGATVATTSGTSIILAEYGFNLRGTPWVEWFPDERFCPKAKQGEGLFVRWETTVADDVSATFTAWIEEE